MTTERIFKPMLAKTVDKYWPKLRYPVFVQPKLDGVRLLWTGHKALSRTLKPLILSRELERSLSTNFAGIPLDGELYDPTLKFEEISGTTRRQTKEKKVIPYCVYDVPLVRTSFKERIGYMSVALKGLWDDNVTKVGTFSAFSKEEVEAFMEGCIRDGYEGAMIRDQLGFYDEGKRSFSLLKYKRWLDEEALVVGFEEGQGKHKGRLGALVVTGKIKPGESLPSWTCRVGTGFSDAERTEIWNNQEKYKLREIVTVKYQELTANGTPRFPVFEGFKIVDLELKEQEGL